MISVSIIIPFLNEEENLERLATKINAFISNHSENKFELIFVNDGSTDNSAEKIKTLNFIAGCRLISLSQNFGSHSALRAGIQHSNGKYVTFMYADLQDPLELISELYQKCESGYDIVWANRNETTAKYLESFFSTQYAALMRRFVNSNFPEKGFDIVMFNEKAKAELIKNVEANSSIFLQILNLGFRQSSIQYKKADRISGKSKWTLSKKIKLLIDSFVAFSYAPIRLVTIMGISFFISGLLWTSYIITRKLIYNDLDPGWPMLISILLVGFGITNISLGIIAEYLWRTLDASRKRPVFIIDEIIDLNNRNDE